MKIYILLLVLILATLNVFSQNCTYTISNDEAQIQYKKLILQNTDQQKLNYINTWLFRKCIYSSNAFTLSSAFYDDGIRLQFCINIFPNIVDKENYYALYDAFSSMSYSFRFHDYVNGITQEPQVIISEPSVIIEAPKLFPTLDYPSSAGYKGFVGCNLPMSDNDFNVLVKPVVDQSGDINRMNTATQFVQNNCVSMAQLMMLSTLLQPELNRIKFLKQNYTKSYDLQNYTYVGQVFSTQLNRDDWNAFASSILKSYTTSPPPVVIECFVSDADMNSIMASIKSASFASTKVTTAKQILNAKQCFLIQQIKQIIKSMSFENDKLDIAKYAYDYCTEKNNYYLMTDVFDYDSSKTDLLNYIKNKK